MSGTIRPMQNTTDIELIVDYFIDANTDFLKGMGADPTKLPKRKDWIKLIAEDLQKPYTAKKFYYVIWLYNNQAVGHTNINKIQYGATAYMHLHIWNPNNRQRGRGVDYLKASIPHYFQHFQLKHLYCEPYALNPAPNKTLPKLGFDFIKAYETQPGPINFFQMVKRYILTKENYEAQDYYTTIR